MQSKHGGSPESGIASPAGIDGLQPIAPGSALFESPLAARRKQMAERERQFERRRIAIEVLPTLAGVTEHAVDDALAMADELMAKTPIPAREARDE